MKQPHDSDTHEALLSRTSKKQKIDEHRSGAEHHYSVVFQLAVGKRIKFKLRHAMRKKKKAGYQKTGMRR